MLQINLRGGFGMGATRAHSVQYPGMPPDSALRRAAHAFLFVIPYVGPDVAGECLEQAARLFWLLGPDPFGWKS